MATILIVDDHAANRKLLVTLLSPHGHRLIEADDGAEGLALVQSRHPDLVITDVLMPIMDGYELVRQIRLDPATSHTPVVFYTAHYGEREARELALASGVAYVLTKPAQYENVLAIVAQALAGESESGIQHVVTPLTTAFDREHLRLVTDKLSEKTGDLRVTNGRLRALVNIGLELASERNSDRLLESICTAARDLLGATYVTLGIVDRHDRRLQRLVCNGTDVTGWIEPGDAVSGMLGVAVAERRLLRGDNPGGDPAKLHLPARHPAICSYLAAPIASPAHVYGWICLVANEGRSFTQEDEPLLMALSGQAGRVYENGYFYSVARKRAEELEQQILVRQQAEDALRKSADVTRNLIEHLPHRILVKDRDSVILFCNANYSRELGVSPEAVIGKDAYAFYPESLAASYHADDREVMDSGIMKDLEEHYQVNGADRWVHTVKVPFHDEQGQVNGVVVVFEDITDRKGLEEQFRQSQRMEAIGQLAGGVAHDFNNLLTAILGYCELLLTDLQPGDPRHSDIAEIQRAGLSAAALTRQLLAFSRKQIIEPMLLDLNTVVVDMRQMLGRLIGENVRVVLALGPRLALVKADAGQMEQIIVNLAVNARDAMPRGGTLTIETADIDLDENYPKAHLPVKPGPYVVLTVTDTGTGITPEVQARLFEPFFTTKPIGKGTGLGLATVHGIVKQNGGSVNVYTEVGRGTSFKVYLPRSSAKAPVVEVPLSPIDPRAEGRTILVVEDADGLRELTRRLLEKQGYTVLVAGNADEAALVFAANDSIDVLLTDVVMPGASGPELTKRLIEQRPDLKVVFMSGYTEESIVHHGVLDAGIAFLHKPFTSDSLRRKLREVFDRRGVRQSGPTLGVKA